MRLSSVIATSLIGGRDWVALRRGQTRSESRRLEPRDAQRLGAARRRAFCTLPLRVSGARATADQGHATGATESWKGVRDAWPPTRAGNAEEKPLSAAVFLRSAPESCGGRVQNDRRRVARAKARSIGWAR